MLFVKEGPRENLIVTGARVLDPGEGIDAMVDVRVDDGTITAIGAQLERNGHRILDGEGLVLAPAFVDPHVHLRTPERLHRLPRRQVQQVERPLLVRGEREVALDHRALGDRRVAGEPELGRDGALVHLAAA